MDVQPVAATVTQGSGAGSSAVPETSGLPGSQTGASAPSIDGAQSIAGAQAAHDVSTLKEPIQQLYGGGADLEVTFRVEHDPNMVVTVFRDSKTGQEIAQFPPEVMVQLAQFFNKLAGAVVDRSA